MKPSNTIILSFAFGFLWLTGCTEEKPSVDETVAVGATYTFEATHEVDCPAFDSGCEPFESVDVLGAVSATPSSLEVLSFSGSSVTVRALTEGRGRVRVEFNATGAVESKTYLIEQQPMASSNIDFVYTHEGLTSTSRSVLAGATLELYFQLLNAQGDRLSGGLAPWGDGEGDAFSEVDYTTAGRAVVTMPESPTTIALNAQGGGTSLDIVVHEESSLDGVALCGRIGNTLCLTPTAGGTSVLGQTATVEMAELTSEVCSVVLSPSEDGMVWSAEMSSLDGGTCGFSITLPNGMDGAGVTTTFEESL